MRSLYESPVVFNPEHHTYDLNGQQLSGITPIIAWLFPDTYKGIPQSVLDNAANYGKLIHSKCELYDSMGIVPDDDFKAVVADYKRIIEAAGLRPLVSEYLVSDEHRIASAIDKVFDDDSLGDIKTTSKVHGLNVQLQLSIYAWLYERMNPERKVKHLYLIWLPKPQYGNAEVRELDRIPATVCEEIVNIWAAGGDPLNAMAILTGCGCKLEAKEKERVEGEVPDEVQPLVDELLLIKKQLDILDTREKEIRKALLDTMTLSGEDKWSSDLITISRRAESERVSIDTKALQKAEPEVYEKFKKVTKVAASLTYKIL